MTASPPKPEAATALPHFPALYETHFDFLWLSLRRLGVLEADLDDALQETFLVVHRRLHTFEGRSALKSWLFGIALRVARDFRRRVQRKGNLAELPEHLTASNSDPQRAAEARQSLQLLYEYLNFLDDEKREVLVMVDLQELRVTEVAEVLGVNVNTVYTRLRAAREQFEAAVQETRTHSHGGSHD